MNSIFHKYNVHKWKRMIALLLTVVLMTMSVSDYGVLAAGGGRSRIRRCFRRGFLGLYGE